VDGPPNIILRQAKGETGLTVDVIEMTEKLLMRTSGVNDGLC